MTDRSRLVFITGLSGSGRSTVAKSFEDLGFYTVDNLPLELLADFLEEPFAHAGEGIRGVAVVTDVRAKGFSERFPKLLASEPVVAADPVVLFLEADDETLVRRFSETRRSHPIAAGSLIESIRTEREMLAEVRGAADRIYDSSEWNIHEIRHQVRREFGSSDPGESGPVVTLMSFGYKYGIPYGSDLLFDVRFLPNPYFKEGLRELTGRDAPVKEFLENEPEFQELVQRLEEFLSYLLPRYATEQRSYVSVAVGCTGGRHRSVAIVEALGSRLDSAGWSLRESHRDIAR